MNKYNYKDIKLLFFNEGKRLPRKLKKQVKKRLKGILPSDIFIYDTKSRSTLIKMFSDQSKLFPIDLLLGDNPNIDKQSFYIKYPKGFMVSDLLINNVND